MRKGKIKDKAIFSQAIGWVEAPAKDIRFRGGRTGMEMMIESILAQV